LLIAAPNPDAPAQNGTENSNSNGSTGSNGNNNNTENSKPGSDNGDTKASTTPAAAATAEDGEPKPFCDIPEKLRHQLKHRELFLSRQVETLPATHIRGKCVVTLLNETENLLSYLNKDVSLFVSKLVCVFWYALMHACMIEHVSFLFTFNFVSEQIVLLQMVSKLNLTNTQL
jgi:hypothetical protein